tara:strand:+ start:37 stop:162 length:126 start_codon:yes stop_codon:yes gene_type:complete
VLRLKPFLLLIAHGAFGTLDDGRFVSDAHIEAIIQKFEMNA